jgi:hypothetical protein
MHEDVATRTLAYAVGDDRAILQRSQLFFRQRFPVGRNRHEPAAFPASLKGEPTEPESYLYSDDVFFFPLPPLALPPLPQVSALIMAPIAGGRMHVPHIPGRSTLVLKLAMRHPAFGPRADIVAALRAKKH